MIVALCTENIMLVAFSMSPEYNTIIYTTKWPIQFFFLITTQITTNVTKNHTTNYHKTVFTPENVFLIDDRVTQNMKRHE